MKNRIFIVFFCFFAFSLHMFSRVICHEKYNYELVVNDSSYVEYLNEDSSTIVIQSLDGLSTFYIVCVSTDDYYKTYNNEMYGSFDGDVFEELKGEPDRIDTFFWQAKEEHFYNLNEAEVCRTKIFLHNDKAILLAGFSRDENLDFVNECMDNFKTPFTMSRTATVLYILLWLIIIIIGVVLWEDYRGMFFLYIIAIAAAIVYFHYILDVSANHYILSFLEYLG